MNNFKRIKTGIKRLATPITIMVVPHSRFKPRKLKIPLLFLVISIFFWSIGLVYILFISVDAIKYRTLEKRVRLFSAQFNELRSTIVSLKMAESEFRRLFSHKSKEDVLESVNIIESNSVDFEFLKRQVNETIESVTEIRRFLKEQKDVYLSTPKGWPVEGVVTSCYGMRQHPILGKAVFHPGIDIRVSQGTPIKATADGIVSFSGWLTGSGYTIVLEHGHGYTTVYAHNSKNHVTVGKRVKRGDIIASSGSSGDTTGPHLHYEIWKNSAQIDPLPYVKGG